MMHVIEHNPLWVVKLKPIENVQAEETLTYDKDNIDKSSMNE